MADITTIILTKNEEKNIEAAVRSVQPISKRIVVVDSFSTDRTTEIAGQLGAEVIQHEFENQARQFNYALDALDIRTQWVFRLDADERVPEEAAEEIERLCSENSHTDVNGIIVRFAVRFLGRELRHGGLYPIRVMRIFKYGTAYIEDLSMDEHTVLRYGRAVEMKSDLEHHDFKQLHDWIDKHNRYSDREMEEYFRRKTSGTTEITGNINPAAISKRFIKNKIYYRMPPGLRAHMYYLYRYYARLGFLDGREGRIYCFLQAYWYRYLVDAKIYEKELGT